MEMKSFLIRVIPFLAMVVAECLDVGLTTLSKAAMSTGMSHFVFIVYSDALASLILIPSCCCFILNRSKRPPVTFSFICKLFLLSLVGITLMQNCVIAGVNYSSPTLASALGNLVPAFTFLLAVIFRMEMLDLRSLRSQIKIMGTLVSIIGALVVTLYQGPSVHGNGVGLLEPRPLPYMTNNWVIGGIFLATSSLCLAILNISQAAILKGYPISEATLVFSYCFFGTIQCAIVSFLAERDNPKAWKIKPDIQLISVIYSGVIGNVVRFCTTAWCIRLKGPMFVAMFKPLGVSIAALMGVIFLNDTLHIGSVIGATIIVVGFYGVMWAQSRGEEKGCDVCRDDGSYTLSSSHRTHLLESYVIA